MVSCRVVMDIVGFPVRSLMPRQAHPKSLQIAEDGGDPVPEIILVLIGHPGIHPDLPEQRISEVVRTFNAQMSRLEVLTYGSGSMNRVETNGHRSVKIDNVFSLTRIGGCVTMET